MTTSIEQAKRFQRLAATELLIAALHKIGEASDFRTITYRELSEIAHAEIQHDKRTCLNTAIKKLRRDHNFVFIVVTDVGVKLATDQEKSAVMPAGIRRIHNTARKSREIGSHANIEKLSNAERLKHMANDAVLGLHQQASRTIVQKRLEASFEKTGPKLLEADELAKLGGIKHLD